MANENEKILKARFKQKIDTTENWKKAGNNGFVPLDGEIIYYRDEKGINGKVYCKVGDGITNINNLPFESDLIKEELETRLAENAIQSTNYTNKTHYGYSGDDLLIIPEGTTEIANNAYKNSNYKCVVIPSSVTSIGVSAFEDCRSLTSITIPNSIKRIGWCAFQGCSSLTSITIPDGVTSIGDHTFRNVPLKIIDLTAYVTESFPTLGIDNFKSITSDCQIKVVKGRKAELAAMTNWSEYADHIVEVVNLEYLNDTKQDKLVNNTSHKVVPVVTQNSSDVIYFTLTPGAGALSVAQRTERGGLRANFDKNFNGMPTEAEKNQQVVNLGYLNERLEGLGGGGKTIYRHLITVSRQYNGDTVMDNYGQIKFLLYLSNATPITTYDKLLNLNTKLEGSITANLCWGPSQIYVVDSAEGLAFPYSVVFANDYIFMYYIAAYPVTAYIPESGSVKWTDFNNITISDTITEV